VIQGEGLCRRYGERAALALDGTLEVGRGEIVAVVGPSGAGKTTLLRLLALLERPSAGRLRFGPGGGDLAAEWVDPWSGNGEGGEMRRVALRRRMGLVTQRTVLFSGTVAENVAYGLLVRGAAAGDRGAPDRGGDTIDAVPAALGRVGLAKAADWMARRLSGGEAQRVALARAIATAPEILLLDEATANLDPANVALIEGIIREECDRGVAVIMATHNLPQARRLADRVILLWEGRGAFDGPAAAFFGGEAGPLARAFVAGELVY
jgi:tungstate transport system ATP-binding protein